MTTPLPTALKQFKHGLGGYTNKGCRCLVCVSARKKSRDKLRNRPIIGDENWHGNVYGYSARGCRCDLCKEAKRQSRTRWPATKKALEPINGDESWHGTTHGYIQRGCRCVDCKFASKVSLASRKFGISKTKAAQMLMNAVCAICGTENPKNKKGFHFDHDHSCCSESPACGNCVRGVLCHKCNAVIGFANDDPEILKAAISYLERFSA